MKAESAIHRDHKTVSYDHSSRRHASVNFAANTLSDDSERRSNVRSRRQLKLMTEVISENNIESCAS